MKKKTSRLICFAAIVMIIVSLISLTRTMCGSRPKRDYRSSEVVGQTIAAETAKLLGDRGNVAVLAGPGGAQQAQLRGFKKRLAKKQDMKLMRVKELTSEEIGESAMRGQIPWEQFRALRDQSRDLTAIVSLVGPPQISHPETTATRTPKLIVFAPMGIGVKDLLADGIVQLAIVPRGTLLGRPPSIPNPNTAQPNSLTGRDPLFDFQYEILTADSDLTSFTEPVVPTLPPTK